MKTTAGRGVPLSAIVMLAFFLLFAAGCDDSNIQYHEFLVKKFIQKIAPIQAVVDITTSLVHYISTLILIIEASIIEIMNMWTL